MNIHSFYETESPKRMIFFLTLTSRDCYLIFPLLSFVCEFSQSIVLVYDATGPNATKVAVSNLLQIS